MSRMVKKSKMKKPRRKFSPAFKEEIVSLIRSGRKSVAEVCVEHELDSSLVYVWKTKFAPNDHEHIEESELEELRRLRKKVKAQEREVEFLKLAAAYFAKESK